MLISLHTGLQVTGAGPSDRARAKRNHVHASRALGLNTPGMTQDSAGDGMMGDIDETSLPALSRLADLSKAELIQTLDFSAECMKVRTASDFQHLEKKLLRILPVDSMVGGIACIASDEPQERAVVLIQHGDVPDVAASWVNAVGKRGGFNTLLAPNQKEPVYWRRDAQASVCGGAVSRKGDDSACVTTGFSYAFRSMGNIVAAFLSCSGPELVPKGKYSAQIAYLMPSFSRALLDCKQSEALATIWSLTPRELEALSWARHGLTNAEIAAKIKISERTIKFHIENAIRKTGAKNRCQAIGLALRHGILT